jgi:hypothetical protein
MFQGTTEMTEITEIIEMNVERIVERIAVTTTEEMTETIQETETIQVETEIIQVETETIQETETEITQEIIEMINILDEETVQDHTEVKIPPERQFLFLNLLLSPHLLVTWILIPRNKMFKFFLKTTDAR